MYKGKTVCAIVPARGGSKSIPWKNLCKIGGKTLVARAIECAKAVPLIDKVICSTDRERIAAEAVRAGGWETKIVKRPSRLSGDDIGDADVLRHADTEHDVVVMLQPTSPLRTPEIVTECITKLIDEDLDSVWTVTETDLHYHPLKQLILINNELRLFDYRGGTITARQQLQPTYTRNGVCYAMTRDCLHHWGTMGIRSGAVVCPGISIDSLEDLHNAENVYANAEGDIASGETGRP